jgi:hypothetical protein
LYFNKTLCLCQLKVYKRKVDVMVKTEIERCGR